MDKKILFKNKKQVYAILIFFIILFLIFSFIKINQLLSRDSKINSAEITSIKSAYHDINLNYYKIPTVSKYGGIDSINNNILFVTGNSELYLLKNNLDNYDSDKFKEVLIQKINNNKDKFVEDFKVELGEFGALNFGIKDILIENFLGYKNKLLLVSSLNYIKEKKCYTLSIFRTEILNEIDIEISGWSKVFDTKKCLFVGLTKNPKFAGTSSGGRISKLDDNNILLSVGDFYADGFNGPILSQDSNNDYGKILKINIKDFSYKIFSLGHRNPQGLYVDQNKNIFSTEHGPESGDELNLIIENKNYGWPLATFGTAYNYKKWPVGETNNTHESFEKPIFSWGNQMAASNLIVYEKDLFNKWKGNLFISSLASKKLVRMVYNKDKKSIIYFEDILIKKRIRDIIQLDNGKIVLLTDLPKSTEIILLDISQ